MDELLRTGVLIAMGTILVLSTMVGGYRVAPLVGVSGDWGAMLGVVVGVGGIIAWFPL